MQRIFFIVFALILGILILFGGFIFYQRQANNQFEGKVNNVIRKSEVKILKNLLDVYTKENPSFLSRLTSSPQKIAKSQLDICSLVVPKDEHVIYIGALPRDPSLGGGSLTFTDCNSNYDTGYVAYLDGMTIIVTAPYAELGETISSKTSL